MANKAVIRITTKALVEALHLPSDTDLQQVWQETGDWKRGVGNFLVSHPSLPETPEGVPYPLAEPEFEKDYPDIVAITAFKGWGL